MFRVIGKTYPQPDDHKTSFGIILTGPDGSEHGTYVWDRTPNGIEQLSMKEALLKSSRNKARGYFYLGETVAPPSFEPSAN